MFIASIFIGGITAYFWGLRKGLLAGGGALALFLLALAIPDHATKVYLLVAIYGGVVTLVGPQTKSTQRLGAAEWAKLARTGQRQWKSWSDKFKL